MRGTRCDGTGGIDDGKERTRGESHPAYQAKSYIASWCPGAAGGGGSATTAGGGPAPVSFGQGSAD
ncbi:hypothetical protein MZO42_16515 [Sphingomonas psychrotolerans]|uniref:Uncharacterized protein n=1 Tax=Sphingomonas psychrotolerans TaxID=1327635 RepID=A0ABU3N9X1_9SPHN|nr:hypothetical protein [Sphingomonas psychrotolerans]MDT8760306.1 hypothetical protein [Sphingomonas psychrotolerans]